ncbi:MAG: zf-HC2 domain-containing protein, partial [Planctomycetes bacterium]|nr:zf-HC2 domain-containing protein [Planctomycetota bacterium]
MTCEQAELRMAELLAGEIAPEERASLERHLLDCATCRGDFELARAGARVEWADVAVPREVVESTLASFREPSPVVRLFRWATAAAAAVAVAALLIASSRAPKSPETVAAACAAERPAMLATMQPDAGVGALVCQDEEGRPVGELGLKSHEVSVEILDGVAKTTVEENFENHTARRLEGTFNFPLPADASISRLALEVNGKIEEGTCLERERAREVFEGIVRRMQDPALLEWQPGGFFKCRVFPIEPRATKRVIVAYTQALPCFQGKMSYVYPLASEKTRVHPPEELRIGVQARFSGGLAKIESPSHQLDVQRKNANEASLSFRAAHYRPNNDFVVTLEPAAEEVRIVSHKTDGEDGYFACIATPQGGGERTPSRYAFVLDASASISAPRLEVAKRLVRGMMERRIEGDRFEVLAHNIEVERSGEVDLRAANTFMDRLRPIGGSDVLQALLAAPADAEIVYIGKGAATFGESEPSKIIEAVKGRRIRTIAVGSDANGQLLEKLGGMMRVNPNDDVVKRAAEIAATLGSPVLTDVKLEGEG